MLNHTKIVGGDATLGRFGAVDWDSKRFMVEDTSRFVEALSTFAAEHDHVEIIAVMELLAFVVFAAQESPTWSGLVVFYVTDNQNERPRGRTAWRLILLLQRLEVEKGFACHSMYMRTYRNQLADWVSRADLLEVRSSFDSQGWVETPFQGDWMQLLEYTLCGPLVLPAGPDECATHVSWLFAPSLLALFLPSCGCLNRNGRSSSMGPPLYPQATLHSQSMDPFLR